MEEGGETSQNQTLNSESNSRILVGKRFRLLRKIGAGSFGDIYLGLSEDDKKEVAIKTEPMNTRHPQLHHESQIYSLFEKNNGFPRVYWYGSNKKYNFLVLDLLGESLEELFNLCGRRFSLKTVLMLGDQMLDRIKYVHSKHYIHRDIKPDNYLIGTGSKMSTIYLIDFGLAKKYWDSQLKSHVPFRSGRHLSGTARYASTNAHLGLEQSRRDDLESLGFVLMYFNRGQLPWQNLKASTIKQKHEKITEKKMSISIETLCDGFPMEFIMFLNYCRTLGFEEDPDYQYMASTLRGLFHNLGYTYDWEFDWADMEQFKVPRRIRVKRSIKRSDHM